MKKALIKLHKVILWYLAIVTPVMLPVYLYVYLKYRKGVEDTVSYQAQGFLGAMFNNLGFIWILSVAYFFMALVFYPSFRERLMSRLAGFKERDEREELVTAKASQRTFLLMLSFQIVLLIMTLTNISMVRQPDGHGVVQVGIGLKSTKHFSLFTGVEAPKVDIDAKGTMEVGGYLLPPNMFMVFLILIMVQIFSFRLFSQRQYKGEGLS